MLIEAVTQTVEGNVYILTGNDDLHVGAGVVIESTYSDPLTHTGADAVISWEGVHTITVDGTIIGEDEAINLIGVNDAQTVIIGATGVLISGGDGVVNDADGIILDGIGSSITNAGTIDSYGSAASLNVRDGGTTTVTNSGSMTGRVSGIWHKFGLGTLVVTNTGTITSANHAILGNESADLITNSGSMTGIVDLAGGNDMLDNRGGTVVGAILGGNGDDLFYLGTTAENIDGGAGFDTLNLSTYTTGVTVDLANPSANKGTAVAGDTLTGIEAVTGTTRADILRGDANDNRFVGNGGSDNLSGADGADTIEGGAAKDSLAGGAGDDVFVFATYQGGVDTITDFTSGEDMIHLKASVFGFGTATGAVSADVFVTGTTNTSLDAGDRFILRTTDNTLWYDKDGTGKKAAILVADLQDGATLTVDDLWLI
jgi:Ca2+-binding RTX toxin-like protein